VPIKAVIFDFGGVLLRTEDDAGRRKWEQRLGIECARIEALVFDSETSRRATVGEVDAGEVWEQFARDFGLDAELLESFYADFWSGDVVNVRLVEFIGSLRPRYKTAILSNAWSNAREAFIEIYDLGGVMDEIIISAEERLAKPDPRIYQIAVDRLGVMPHEAVFVDDMLANVEAARALGFCGVHFKDTDQTIADVQRCLHVR